MKNKIKGLLTVLLTAIIVPRFVLANNNPFDDFFGGLGEGIQSVIQGIIGFTVELPFLGAGMTQIPFWVLVAFFALFFAIIYPASKKIGIFADNSNRRPRQVFAISLSFIVIFASPIIPLFYSWMEAVMAPLIAFISVATVFVFAILAYWLLGFAYKGERSVTGEIQNSHTKSQKSRVDRKKTKKEVDKVEQDVDRMDKLMKAEEQAVQKITGPGGILDKDFTDRAHIKENLDALVEILSQVPNVEQENAKKLVNQAEKSLSTLLSALSRYVNGHGKLFNMKRTILSDVEKRVGDILESEEKTVNRLISERYGLSKADKNAMAEQVRNLSNAMELFKTELHRVIDMIENLKNNDNIIVNETRQAQTALQNSDYPKATNSLMQVRDKIEDNSRYETAIAKLLNPNGRLNMAKKALLKAEQALKDEMNILGI